MRGFTSSHEGGRLEKLGAKLKPRMFCSSCGEDSVDDTNHGVLKKPKKSSSNSHYWKNHLKQWKGFCRFEKKFLLKPQEGEWCCEEVTEWWGEGGVGANSQTTLIELCQKLRGNEISAAWKLCTRKCKT